MEATFQEELKAQREEEMTITVPDDIDGPRNIAEWYTNEHVNLALQYYANVTNTSHDPDHVTHTKTFYECVLGNKVERSSMPGRKRLKDKDTSIKMGKAFGKVTDYLHLTRDGDRMETEWRLVIFLLIRGMTDLIG